MLKRVIAVLIACLVASSTYAQDQALPDANSVPKDVIQLSPTVPQMGEHWANPKDMPIGPIYCVHNGKIVCLEFMISQSDFAAGKTWPALAGMKDLPAVDHLSILFEPNGYEGYEVPHYDLHMFFVSPEELAKIQP